MIKKRNKKSNSFTNNIQEEGEIENLKIHTDKKEDEKKDSILKLEIEQSKTDQMPIFYGPKKQDPYKNFSTVDYNPSICKDFFENGYCTWGNTCIYAHIRGEIKSSNQLDKDWNK